MTRQLRAVGKLREHNLVIVIVDETLKEVFKEAGAKAVYDYMENKCHLKREEIAEKPEIFSACLKRLISSGALVIEKLILKNLCSTLELEFVEKKGYEFSHYTRKLRKCGVIKA